MLYRNWNGRNKNRNDLGHFLILLSSILVTRLHQFKYHTHFVFEWNKKFKYLSINTNCRHVHPIFSHFTLQHAIIRMISWAKWCLHHQYSVQHYAYRVSLVCLDKHRYIFVETRSKYLFVRSVSPKTYYPIIYSHNMRCTATVSRTRMK